MTDQKEATEMLSFESSVPSDGFECYWLMLGRTQVGSLNGPQTPANDEFALKLVAAFNASASQSSRIEELEKALKGLDLLLDFSVGDDLSGTWEFEDTSAIKAAFEAAHTAITSADGGGA